VGKNITTLFVPGITAAGIAWSAMLFNPGPAGAQDTAKHTDKAHADHGEKAEAVSSHGAGDMATVLSKVRPLGDIKIGQPLDTVLQLTDKKSGTPIKYDDLREIHTERIHLLVVDPSLSDYQHIHPKPTDKSGEYKFQFVPRKSGAYKFFSDLLPVKSNAQEYSVAELTIPGEAEPLRKSENRETESGPYKFKLTFESPKLVQGTPNVATLAITGPDGKPFDKLEPVMGAFAHMVAFSEDRKYVTHVHPQGKEPEKADERGGPELTFYLIANQPGYHQMYAQVQIGGKDVFAPFGLQVEPKQIPQDVAGILAEVDVSLARLKNIIELKQLSGVHGVAFWIRDIVRKLPEVAGDLDDAKKTQLNASVKRIASYADLLDRYGDAHDAIQTETVFQRFAVEIESIRKLLGVGAPEQKESADAKPLNNANCPVSNMPVGSMEPGASLVYEGRKIGLCCNGCKATFDKDPKEYYEKALKSVKP
jgi:hypothetical protein